MDGGLASPDGPAGCAAQCITTALVDPTHDGAGLHVETHTSSILDVWVSTGPTDTSGDEPTFGPDVDKAATTDGLDVTSWDATLPDLLADTTYHVIVRATDLTGGRSFRVGSFHTEHGPQFLVRFRAVVDARRRRRQRPLEPGRAELRLGCRRCRPGDAGRGEDQPQQHRRPARRPHPHRVLVRRRGWADARAHGERVRARPRRAEQVLLAGRAGSNPTRAATTPAT